MANLIRLKQIESGSALQTSAEVGADFSASVINIITGEVTAVLPDGVISSSAQLDGSTIKNLTLSTENADRYSLIVSGAVSVVDATNLSGSDDFEMDTTVPGQIYLVSGTFAPPDPVVNGNPQSNIIDQGEW